MMFERKFRSQRGAAATKKGRAERRLHTFRLIATTLGAEMAGQEIVRTNGAATAR